MNVPKKVMDRIGGNLRKYQAVLKGAKDRDVNESDTVTIVTDILADVFGYDKYSEVTSEQAIRGTYCDLAIEIDGSIKYLLEVKSVGIGLKENHLRQAINYGANKGIQWVILTNGVSWEVYRLRFEKPIDYDLLFSFDFLELNTRRVQDRETIFMLSREGLVKAAIEKYQEHVHNVNKFMISAIIQSEPCSGIIKRELKRLAPGVKVSSEEVARILVSDVLKRDVVEGDQLQKAMFRLKKSSGKVLRRRRSKKSVSTDEVPPIATTDTRGDQE